LGHDVILLPLYTPTLTDEPNVSDNKVFFGGISVYLEQHSAIFRHTPIWLDRIWDSKFALQAASKGSITVDPASLGELTISMLRGENGHQRKEILKLIGWLKDQQKPDVIDLQNSLLSGLARPLKEATGRPICCTLQGEDLYIANLHQPYRDEALKLIRENAKHIDAFIAVSSYYADFMTDYLQVPPAKMHVVDRSRTTHTQRSSASVTLPVSRRKKGCICWRKHIGFYGSERVLARHALRLRVILRRNTDHICIKLKKS
jgi:hypothetical protein